MKDAIACRRIILDWGSQDLVRSHTCVARRCGRIFLALSLVVAVPLSTAAARRAMRVPSIRVATVVRAAVCLLCATQIPPNDDDDEQLVPRGMPVPPPPTDDVFYGEAREYQFGQATLRHQMWLDQKQEENIRIDLEALRRRRKADEKKKAKARRDAIASVLVDDNAEDGDEPPPLKSFAAEVKESIKLAPRLAALPPVWQCNHCGHGLRHHQCHQYHKGRQYQCPTASS